MSNTARHLGLQGTLAFVKTTIVGGVVFLIPVLILVALVGKAASLLERLAQPLAAHIPSRTLLGLLAADLVAVVVVILVCFLAGLVARVSFAHRFVQRAEAGVLWRIPGYGFLKGLTDSLDKSAAASSMRPVLAHFDDYAQLAFEIDQLADGRRVIYVPSAPDPRAGAVLVVDAGRVEPVPLSFAAAIGALRSLGRGFGQSLAPLPRAPQASALKG